MKVGDLVKTAGFGPQGSVGEVGMIIREFPRIVRCWEVLFVGVVRVVAQDGLEVISESR